jgi:cytochrome c oxidase subunit 3
MESSVKMNDEYELRKQKAQRNLMWLALGSIVMLFAGLTSAYVVRRGAGDWFGIVLPQIFWVSCAVILFSSVTMNISLQSFRNNKSILGIITLGLTLALGLTFAWCQFHGWKQLTMSGVYLVQAKGQTSLISGSFIYLLSGLHLAHMAGGVLALVFTFIKSLLGRYNSANVHGLRVCAIYWHFLTVLWIYLFVFLTIFK